MMNFDPGKCFACGKWVEAAKGELARQHGRLKLYCTGHVPVLEAPPPPTAADFARGIR
jgi:hypothetical protein